MKKTLILALFFITTIGFSQSKETNPFSVQNFAVGLLLDNTTQTVTLNMKGPSDRWLAVQFGQFSGGMEAGSDVVYFNGTTLIDATQDGISNAPAIDVQNNWTVIENSVSSGLRTLVATRDFDSTDSNDYDFNYNDSTIGLALALASELAISFDLEYHGITNRIINTSLTFTNLSKTIFTIADTKVYPNPTENFFTVSSPVDIDRVSIYTHTGSLVRIVSMLDAKKEIHVSDLESGVYLIELKSNNEKSWQKVIVK